MYLTRTEERMISGEYGEVISKAMKAVVKVGEVLGADRLIQVTHAHVSGVSYFNIGDPGLEFIEDMAGKGARFAVFTTVNPYAIIGSAYGKEFPHDVVSKQLRIVNALKKMGANSFTCAPYYIRKPKVNEHLAWAESNAVLYANSIAGARTNREGGPLALFEALIGRTYYAGVHKDDGRIPKIYVSVKKPKNFLDASLLGYITGEYSPKEIPYVSGLNGVEEEKLRSFLAVFGARSSAPMVVIEGVTPEYSELLEKADFMDRLVIDEDDVRKLIRDEALYGRGVFIIGCPHLSLKEIMDIAGMVLRRCNTRSDGKELWLITGTNVVLPDELESKLERVGVKVLKGMCPVVTRLDMLDLNYVITDSGKALFYLPRLAKVRVMIMDRKDIIRKFCGGAT